MNFGFMEEQTKKYKEEEIYDKQAEIMRGTIRSIDTAKVYRLDKDNIKTLDDIKNVLEGICGEILIPEGLSVTKFDKLKDYLKRVR